MDIDLVDVGEFGHLRDAAKHPVDIGIDTLPVFDAFTDCALGGGAIANWLFCRCHFGASYKMNDGTRYR